MEMMCLTWRRWQSLLFLFYLHARLYVSMCPSTKEQNFFLFNLAWHPPTPADTRPHPTPPSHPHPPPKANQLRKRFVLHTSMQCHGWLETSCGRLCSMHIHDRRVPSATHQQSHRGALDWIEKGEKNIWPISST